MGSRRLPGSAPVGHHDADDARGMLCRSALVRRRAPRPPAAPVLEDLRDRLLGEPPPGRPLLVHLGEHRAQKPDQRLPGRERLDPSDQQEKCVFVSTKGLSIVGSRPALVSEVAIYTQRQRQRLLVKGGITCYWQTRRNRDLITFDEWVDLGLWNLSKSLYGTTENSLHSKVSSNFKKVSRKVG